MIKKFISKKYGLCKKNEKKRKGAAKKLVERLNLQKGYMRYDPREELDTQLLEDFNIHKSEDFDAVLDELQYILAGRYYGYHDASKYVKKIIEKRDLTAYFASWILNNKAPMSDKALDAEIKKYRPLINILSETEDLNICFDQGRIILDFSFCEIHIEIDGFCLLLLCLRPSQIKGVPFSEYGSIPFRGEITDTTSMEKLIQWLSVTHNKDGSLDAKITHTLPLGTKAFIELPDANSKISISDLREFGMKQKLSFYEQMVLSSAIQYAEHSVIKR